MASGPLSHLGVSFVNPHSTPPRPHLASGTNSVGYCETCLVPIIIIFFSPVLLFLMTNKTVVLPAARQLSGFMFSAARHTLTPGPDRLLCSLPQAPGPH